MTSSPRTGAQVDVDYRRGVPPVVNDRLATAVIAGAAAAALGPDRVVEAELSMGGEDFAFYLEQVPGSMIRLGCRHARRDRRSRISTSRVSTPTSDRSRTACGSWCTPRWPASRRPGSRNQA